jgi:hypothetical protein
MAVTGTRQKSVKVGRTPNANWTEVPDVPYTDGEQRDLPKLGRNKKWHPRVEQWWSKVRTMPHCVLWREPDWEFAIDLAYMKNDYWRLFEAGESTTSAATEIRRREDQLGVIAEARRKLLIRYVPVDTGEDVGLPPETEVYVEETGPSAGAPRRAAARRSSGDDPDDDGTMDDEDGELEGDAGRPSATVTPLADRRRRLTA